MSRPAPIQPPSLRPGRDADAVTWIGSASAGVLRLEPGRFRTFDERDGLPQRGVVGVGEADLDGAGAVEAATGIGFLDHMLTALARHALFDAAIRDLAESAAVPLFSRAALMRDWAAAGTPNAELLGDDGLHHNDRGYACLAEALARDSF